MVEIGLQWLHDFYGNVVNYTFTMLKMSLNDL